MLNWNYLETFVILSENLNFSVTAQLLNTAQPVVSRQIKQLEADLGHPLFIRSKKKVVLSDEGRNLKNRLNPLVDEIKKIIREREGNGDQPKGVIRLGSLYEAGHLMLYPRIIKYLEQNKQMRIHTTFMSSFEVNENISAGILDFGFVYQLSDRKTLRSFPVASDTAVMIADRKQAGHWRDIDTYQMIGYREKDLYLRDFLDRNMSKTERKKVEIGSSVNSHAQIIDLVRRQKAFAVIPKSSVMKAVDSGHVEIVLQDKKPQSLYLICHEQILIDKRKKLFLDYLLNEFS